MMEVGTG